MGQIVNGGQRIGISGAKYLAASIYGFSKKRFRLLVAVLQILDASQIVDASYRIRMSRPKHLASGLQNLLIELLRLALGIEDARELAATGAVAVGLALRQAGDR